ncbi:tRNA (adenosine(37)-N6)-threonylcarbamoyltransferase complex ATPase subunit type 1 TsaE [Flavobacterium arcticum]|uniref:tRNA threonylcarbamoyladenosine biosynthesis protein TsaE n=1 Tax=Flavobacterium arcticum TaxID=1784713 RepID=A0A345HDE5_9FLAO|nr:tRNA (adenosine(37)-N6)-threonylcarbamoyltransferase complex ATPase subunit type 1 TsaE [Flavobacterium arcticum]AXG74605.1 tRNA (adenosine(37)-N6)-threonylcarbamoyltransferase complex ATPase subunit type 1 TsaE [Flavobacterium arcticum]KAF2512273.1 tRNA (adenosine(37)-N6)-threonylcarbamoyltransferase complex ATPase subunit type 1 TsaE [Flavobacterium arcticum]
MEITFSLEEIDATAKQLLAADLKQIVVFHASMGAGKTTLIKAIARQMGVKDITSSPTFSLVNEYETAGGKPLFHFDLYRLNTEEEAYDMGIDEYFYSGNMCLIEWPEKTPNLIPLDHSSISIKQLADGRRHVTLK